jgi:hypothetical protein
MENGRQCSPLCTPSPRGRFDSCATELQQVGLALQQQQQQPLWQRGQWHWHVVLLLCRFELELLPSAACIASQWQPGSKCPVGLKQPETSRPFNITTGTIAQITAARKRLRIARIRSLPVMRHQLD